VNEVSDHLFRRESGRLVATLTRIFGVHNLALAEDVAQDAFCRALEVWKLRGVPENPSAWLMTTAKNRALDVLRRERTARTFAPELGRLLQSEWTLAPTLEEQLSPPAIRDDELRMMFSCCQPRLPETAQVALILHLLCGFSIGEVAAAFLSSEAAMEKRLWRAKKALAGSQTLFDLNGDQIPGRRKVVQRALYLLFNEGYHGACAESAVRVELCQEAIRLARLLLAHPLTATPTSYALAALMYLHAARLPARLNAAGELNALCDQDRSLWDTALLAEGQHLLDLSATGIDLSEYHIEAGIAALHGAASGIPDTDWTAIVFLYDLLLQRRPSPVVALSRAIALAQRDGPEAGITAIQEIPDVDRLARYPFYFAALGELELQRARPETARPHFTQALALARSPTERRFLERRLEATAPRLTPQRPCASPV